jgi:hypothetical protein
VSASRGRAAVAAALLLALPAAHGGAVSAEFRGCEAAGCLFLVESAGGLLRVLPDGAAGGGCDAIARRDRLNALLSSMIHQHKRIALHDLRALGDGRFSAAVTVNGQPLAADPVLAALRERRCDDGS